MGSALKNKILTPIRKINKIEKVYLLLIISKEALFYQHQHMRATRLSLANRVFDNVYYDQNYYSQTCLKGSPKGRTKIGRLRQGTP